MWQNTLSGVLGLVVILVAFLGLTGTTLTWTLAILGILIALFSFSGMRAPSGYTEGQRRESTR